MIRFLPNCFNLIQLLRLSLFVVGFYLRINQLHRLIYNSHKLLNLLLKILIRLQALFLDVLPLVLQDLNELVQRGLVSLRLLDSVFGVHHILVQFSLRSDFLLQLRKVELNHLRKLHLLHFKFHSRSVSPF